MKKLDATILDAGGREHPLTSDEDGRLRVENASIGPFKLRMWSIGEDARRVLHSLAY